MINMNLVSEKSKKIYSFMFSISFILNGYASGIPGISLGSVVYFIYLLYSIVVIIKNNNRFKIGKKACFTAPLVLVFTLFFLSLTTNLFNNNLINSVGKMMADMSKLFLWAYTISVTNYIFFDYREVKKYLVNISIILTIYIFIQTISFYTIRLYLPNIFKFGFIRPYAEGYAAYELLSAGNFIRPASLMSESAFFGNFVLCALTLYLFDIGKLVGKNKVICACFLSLGIILSTSTSAIYFLIFVWGIFLYKNYKSNTIIFVLFFLVVVLLIFLLNSKIELFDSEMSDIGESLKLAVEKPKYFMTSSRIGKSFNYLRMLDSRQLFFGVGIGNEEAYIESYYSVETIYLNSITSLIFWCGLLGVLLVLIFMYSVIYKCKDIGIVILFIMYTVQAFTSGILFSTYGILFMSIIIYKTKYFPLTKKCADGKKYIYSEVILREKK